MQPIQVLPVMNGLETTRLLADSVDQTHDTPHCRSAQPIGRQRMRPAASVSNIKSSCSYNFRIWGHVAIIPADHTARFGRRRGDQCQFLAESRGERGQRAAAGRHDLHV
jgi:hypothetical protein